MDKRAVAAAFRERLQALLGDERGGVAGFLRDTGIDRSALSQFLDPGIDRMPRAETLRRIAEARGVTADWLLSLSNAPEGQQEVTPSVRIELAQSPEGGSPIDQWRREAAGMKLRYVPSSLPDMLGLADDAPVPDPAPAGQPENILGGFRLGEMDVEIAMPVQTLEDLSQGAGLWRGTDPALRRRQLAHMAATCAETYPTLRLHLYDGRTPSPRRSRSSAAFAPRSTSARPISSSPRPSRSRRCPGSSTTWCAAPSSARSACRTCSTSSPTAPDSADRRRESAPSPSVPPGPLGPGSAVVSSFFCKLASCPLGRGAALRALDRRLDGVPGSSAPR